MSSTRLLERADDDRVLDFARADQRVCVTLDHDFHTHLAISRAGQPSVILLRVQGLSASEQARVIRSVCDACAEYLREGAAVSADEAKVRVRTLPLK